ncbi:hypothetical protein U7230_01745 [Carboxydochorda subterranea]|uniref:Ferric oxidoreductase domain-containing protein n=1 Tax=Carboxydichorda subterranea TaxID=3109565 RepID=A0ABZ1C0C2_9FIRM|nr:hypothetical protein [Limnochorda sp. L945t]WRP17758.1 hypothetical protein U7230_01745 [Limnochorda sp. L945t]
MPLESWSAAWWSPWYLSRAAGLTSLLFYTLAVAAAYAGAMARARRSRASAAAFTWHRLLSIVAWGFALFHALILRSDPKVPFSWQALLVPFVAPYRPFGTGLGVLALYALSVLLISFDGRTSWGNRWWRAVHRWGNVMYAVAVGHGLMAGTDLGPPLLRLAVGALVAVATVAAERWQRAGDRAPEERRVAAGAAAGHRG